jgi:hypothetical protein
MNESMRLSLILAFSAALAGTAAAQEICPVERGVEDIFAAPVIVRPIAVGRAVPVRPGAAVASEEVALVTRTFRADRPIRLRGKHSYAYPPDARVAALRTAAGERRCLRDLPRGSRGPNGGQTVACLIDGDGDGAWEAAELFRSQEAFPLFGARARFEPSGLAPLADPVRLAEAVPEVPDNHFAAFRRISVAGVTGETAELRVEHASLRERVSFRDRDGRTVTIGPRGRPVFEPWPGGNRTVRLVDGAVESVGGIRFRIARAGPGWTITPLDAQFPEWIAYQCGGSHLQIGRP